MMFDGLTPAEREGREALAKTLTGHMLGELKWAERAGRLEGALLDLAARMRSTEKQWSVVEYKIIETWANMAEQAVGR